MVIKKEKEGMLSIAIPTFNEETDLKDCLNSIASQNYDKNLFEVIIIDNNSQDKTIDIAKSFLNKINIRILKNEIKDAEVSKKIGFDNSRGEFFMYLDADMRFVDKEFIKKMLYPFFHNKKIAGNFIRFIVNKKHPALTRTLSYDEFQRDPIFKFFTIGINKVVIKKNKSYWLCRCHKEMIPPQGLMIYRRKLILEYTKRQKQLIDNEIPAVLVEMGYEIFAFVPDTGVEHLLLRSLKELWKKRIRNLDRTYYPNLNKRKFKWINWGNDWPKIGIWLIYTHSIILPIINAVYKSFKYEDICFLNEPILNLVSTYALIFGVLKNIK